MDMTVFLAEVSDKIPLPGHALAAGVVVGLFVACCGSHGKGMAWVAVILSLVPAYVFIIEAGSLGDDLKREILSEQGPLYYSKMRLAFAIPYGAGLAGVILLQWGLYRERLCEARSSDPFA